jgi:hypothetical protein
MDIYCTRCGEPVELDYIHDRVEELRYDGELVNGQPPTFTNVKDDFVKRGCVAMGFGPCKRVDNLRTQASAALFDILGDDVDGVASMMEDFEFLMGDE